MKKIFLSLFIMIFVLSACNLPTAQTTPVADANEIATRVAGTMAAAGPTQTISLPTEGTLPTVEMETATFTPTETVTVTPTSTPTTPPDDPKLTLGTPDFWFSSASSGDPFGVVGDPYDDDAVTISNQVGGLDYTSKGIDLGKRWLMTSRQPTNFYLEGTFKTITCSGKDNYGLAMRKPKYESGTGYYVGLSCEGNYIVDRIDQSGNGETISGWMASSAINPGENQVNRLGVMLIGDSIKVYINGVFVNEFIDSVIPTKGYIGTYISARGNPNFSFVLQELKEWDQ
jgi:hypothetical protein